MRLEVATSEQMEALGETLGSVARAGDVIVLTGELGAGKTTLARGVGRALNLETAVSSPTFVVARTHRARTPGAAALVHVDAYRIGSAGEFEDLDIDLEHQVVLAEWARPFIEVLTDSFLHVEVTRPTAIEVGELDEDEPRQVVITAVGPHSERYQRFLDAAGALA